MPAVPELIPIPSPGTPLWFGEPGAPLVVVVHDWYGRTPGLEPLATALAYRGFRVAVPDLFNGVCTIDAGDAELLMRALDLGDALAELDDVIAIARTEGSERVGILGFSMGGWLALLYAQGGEADAVVAYYASLAPEEHGIIPAPVLLHFAEVDEWREGSEPASFIARLKDHSTPVATHTYLATQHSFANSSIASRIDPNAAALAFARSVQFFSNHLVD